MLENTNVREITARGEQAVKQISRDRTTENIRLLPPKNAHVLYFRVEMHLSLSLSLSLVISATAFFTPRSRPFAGIVLIIAL
jgi:hypothetical protein